MKTSDFYFNLPEDCIAQYPSKIRGDDRLLVLNRDKDIDDSALFVHKKMSDFLSLVDENSLLVFNNSRVRKSRLFAKKINSSQTVEFLFIHQYADGSWKVMVRNAKKHKPGHGYVFSDGTEAKIIERESDRGTEFRSLLFDVAVDEAWFERLGHVPLPPYIKREDALFDESRYQNIYASEVGSSACPTAGLHFTPDILEALKNKGIDTAFLTLHVGLGTFLPVRSEKIEEHTMHEEVYTISEETADKINAAKKEGKKIIAVGTTSVRSLESNWDDEKKCLTPGSFATSIFLYPGYEFKLVDQLFTNFHTPESTLLMLVSAFAGKEKIFKAYDEAIKENYRFFSYGDAMFIR